MDKLEVKTKANESVYNCEGSVQDDKFLLYKYLRTEPLFTGISLGVKAKIILYLFFFCLYHQRNTWTAFKKPDIDSVNAQSMNSLVDRLCFSSNIE